MMNQQPKQELKSVKWSNAKHSTSYFVTIYTNNKVPYLANVMNGNIQLSPAGQVAYNFWNELPKHFEDITLNAFAIMPEHIHGIITIKNNQHNISNIINAYMIAVEQTCKQIKYPIQWQPNHYAHLVKEENIYENIVDYINAKIQRFQQKIA